MLYFMLLSKSSLLNDSEIKCNLMFKELIFFRVWDTCQWEPDRWTLASGRVVSAVWSPCSSLVLFAISLEPVIFSLSCGTSSSVFQSEDQRAASPLIDLTPVELLSGER